MLSEKILIVDDNPYGLKLSRIVLESEGFEVLTAYQPYQAFNLIETQKPKVLIIDLEMITFDAIDFIEKVRVEEKVPDLRILAIRSGKYKNPVLLTEGAIQGFLYKPINTRTLGKTILSLVKGVATPA